MQESEFVAVVKQPSKDGRVLIEMRNRFCVGDTLEVISPNDAMNKKIVIQNMTNTDGEPVEVADQVQQQLYIDCGDLTLTPLDILRR